MKAFVVSVVMKTGDMRLESKVYFMKKQILAMLVLLTVSASSFAGINNGQFLGFTKTTEVSYYVPENALYNGDPYVDPGYLYTVAEATLSHRYTNLSYNLAMGIHDVNDNGVTDTWYIGDNRYGATAGSPGAGAANWNIDVYVNPVILGLEKLTGEISYSSVEGGASEWTSAIDFNVSREIYAGSSFLGKVKWYLSSDASGSENADLVFGTKSYMPNDSGYYTITLDYGHDFFGVSNTIVVEVGQDTSASGNIPVQAPIVPAPAAIFLSGIGTVIAGRIRRI